MQLCLALTHNILYSFQVCLLWNYTRYACGYVWESASEAPSPYLCPQGIFNPLFDSVNRWGLWLKKRLQSIRNTRESIPKRKPLNAKILLRWEQKYFSIALEMHTIILIDPVPESLKDTKSAPFNAKKKISRDIYYFIKKQKRKKIHDTLITFPWSKNESHVYESFPFSYEKALLFPLKWQSFQLSSLKED